MTKATENAELETVTTTATAPENSGDNSDANKPALISMTSEQLNERLTRAKSSDRETLFKELGVTTLDEAKAKIAAAVKAEQDRLSDLQKVEQAKTQAEKERDELKLQLETVAKKQREADTNKVIEKIASDEKALFADDVVSEIRKRHAEDVAEWEKPDGKVDEKALKTYVEAIRKDRPNWFPAENPGSMSNNGGKLKVAPPDAKAKEAAAAAQFNHIRGKF